MLRVSASGAGSQGASVAAKGGSPDPIRFAVTLSLRVAPRAHPLRRPPGETPLWVGPDLSTRQMLTALTEAPSTRMQR